MAAPVVAAAVPFHTKIAQPAEGALELHRFVTNGSVAATVAREKALVPLVPCVKWLW